MKKEEEGNGVIPRSEIHLTYKDNNSIQVKYISQQKQKKGKYYDCHKIVTTEIYDDPIEFFKCIGYKYIGEERRPVGYYFNSIQGYITRIYKPPIEDINYLIVDTVGV